MKTRHYKILGKNGNETKRLVLAENQSAALKHVVENTLTVSLATTADVISLIGGGVKEETAGAAPDDGSNPSN